MPGFYEDWHRLTPELEWKGTPEERVAAIRCLERMSRGIADGAAGLRTVIQALGLDDEPERCPGCDQGVKTPTGKCSAGCGWGA